MKKFMLLYFTMLSCFFSPAFAQTNEQRLTEQDITTLLCHKWKYTEMAMGEQKLPMPFKLARTTLLLKSDGTMVKTEDEEDIPGKWTYDHKNLTLKLEDKDGTEKNKLMKITDTELMFRNKFEGVYTTYTMKRVD